MKTMKTMKTMKAASMLLFMLIFMTSFNAFSQDENNKDKGWNFVIAPYIWAPITTGEVVVNGNGQGFETKPADLLSSLNMAGMLYFEAANAHWSISADLLYVNLGNDVTIPGDSLQPGSLDAKLTSFGVYGMYRVAKWFEVGVGGRFTSANSELKAVADPANDLPAIDEKANNSFFDPLIVYRFTVPIKNEKWHAGLRGDIGGFGVGSQFTYLVYPYGGYQFSKLFELTLGFRASGLDFESGSGADLHKLNLNLYGPQIGLLFHL
jgi:hypothetical protein